MAASLASALRLALKLRRWKEAEAFGIEALAIAIRTVGPDNSKTLAARANLMTVYLRSGNFADGEEHGSLALAEFERVLGADHLRTLSTKQALAKVLMSAGKWEAANAHLLEIVAIAREKYADSPLLPGSLGNSITTLINTHRAAEAEPLARELLAWCEGHGLDKPTIGRCHLWIARVAYAQSDFEVAGSSLALALEILKGNMPEEHWAVRYTQMLDHLVAYRLGSHERGAEAEIMFRSLVGGTPRMRIENRNTLMPEARRLITEAGLKAVETTE